MNDVDDECGGRRERTGRWLGRRAWLADCSRLLAAAGLVAVMPARGQGSAGTATEGATAAAPSGSGPGSGRPKILVVGDSLSAEYGIARGSGWVALMAARLAERYSRASVVNASISGDTTAGGRTRLPALLSQHRPDIVVIELGANDALRGLPLATTRDNLAAMVRASRAIRADVVLVGMQLPPNYGRRYGAEFAGLYADLAKDERTALVPFMFAGFADGPDAESMFQPDRIHPLARAHPKILETIWPAVEPLVKARSRPA